MQTTEHHPAGLFFTIRDLILVVLLNKPKYPMDLIIARTHLKPLYMGNEEQEFGAEFLHLLYQIGMRARIQREFNDIRRPCHQVAQHGVGLSFFTWIDRFGDAQHGVMLGGRAYLSYASFRLVTVETK